MHKIILMSKEVKKKKDKKKSKDTKNEIKKAIQCKSKCCDKYLKGEKKRCSRCPMFDLLAKKK